MSMSVLAIPARIIASMRDQRGSANRVFLIGLGYAVSQGTVLLATPWLARRFDAVEFGLLANLLSVSNIAINLGALRLDHAILVSDSDGDAQHLRDAALLLALLWGTAIAGFLLLSGRWMAMGPDLPWLVGTTVLLVTATQAIAMVLMRRGRIRSVAVLRASQGVVFVALALTLDMGLGYCFALSWGLGALAFLPWAVARPRLAMVASTVVRYGRFPLLGSIGSLMDVVGFSVAVWAMSTSYGLAECGRVTQAQRLVGAPMMLLALSLGHVLQRRWADDVLHGGHQVAPNFRRVFVVLASLAIAWVFVILLIGPQLARLVFGPGWIEDRWLLTALSAAVSVRAVVSPLSGLLIVRREFGRSVAWQAAYLVIALAVLPAAASRIDLHSFVWLYSGLEIFMYSVYFFVIRRSVF
jgi:O-antigen/teichoic acid export membrane protein